MDGISFSNSESRNLSSRNCRCSFANWWELIFSFLERNCKRRPLNEYHLGQHRTMVSKSSGQNNSTKAKYSFVKLCTQLALNQAANQGLSDKIRFAKANTIFIFEVCFSGPRYRVRRYPSCRFTTAKTCSAFFAAYCPLADNFLIWDGFRCHCNIMQICSGDLYSMRQNVALVYTDERFIPKEPFNSLLDGMRIGITLLFRIFYWRRCRYYCWINNGSFFKIRPFAFSISTTNIIRDIESLSYKKFFYTAEISNVFFS